MVLKAQVLPLLGDWTPDHVEAAIAACELAGLVRRFTTTRGAEALWFPLFGEWNRVRADREAPSALEPLEPELLEHAGSTPGVLPPKANQGKEGNTRSMQRLTGDEQADRGSASYVCFLEDVLELTGERNREQLWRKLYLALGEQRMRQAMAETRVALRAGEIRTTAGAHLVGRCKAIAQLLSIELGLNPARQPPMRRRQA